MPQTSRSRQVRSPTSRPNLNPAVSGFLKDCLAAALVPPAPTRSTLLTGRLHGVRSRAIRRRQPTGPDALKVVLGASTPDLAATVAAGGTGLGATDQRAAERLLAAFGAGLTWDSPIPTPGPTSTTTSTPRIRVFARRHRGNRPLRRQAAPRTDPGAGFRPGAVITRAAEAERRRDRALERDRTSEHRCQDDDRGCVAADSRRHRRHPAQHRAAPGPTGRRPGSRGQPVGAALQFPAAPIVAVVGGGRLDGRRA